MILYNFVWENIKRLFSHYFFLREGFHSAEKFDFGRLKALFANDVLTKIRGVPEFLHSSTFLAFQNLESKSLNSHSSDVAI